MCVSVHIQLCLTLCDPIDCNVTGSSVQGFFQVRILSGLPCPPPGDLPNPGTELYFLASPALTGRFTPETNMIICVIGIIYVYICIFIYLYMYMSAHIFIY